MNNYLKKLKKLVPYDKNINESNVNNIFYNIANGTEIKELFHSNLMFASVAALIKMLYDDNKVNITGNTIENKMDIGKYYYKCTNVLRNNLELKQPEISNYIFENRKRKPNILFYQSYNTYDSLIRRLSLMQQFGDDTQKNIVFIGDDELFSVFFALNAESYKRILVLDIDDSLLNEINWYSKTYNLNIETRKYNIFDNNYYDNDFDVFFSSGLKNLAGLLLFILTGKKFLNSKKNTSGYFTYYPYISSLSNIQLDQDNYNLMLQKKLIEYGFIIEHLSVCDESNISDSMIRKLKNWIYNSNELLIKNDTEFMKSIKGTEEIGADPLFPYFSLRPINIARVKPLLNCEKKIEDYINISKRMNQ